MTAAGRSRGRPRGTIEELPGGALRVSVYVGKDPISGRRHYLRETVPAGAGARKEAEKVLRHPNHDVDEQRTPRTSAMLDRLLDRYLETLDVGATTHRAYTRYLELHVRPFLGRTKAGAVGAEALDSLYAELRRCRDHCSGSVKRVDHRTPREHECDDRHRPHRWRPLGAATIRHIHVVLNGAYPRGVRWRWVSRAVVVSGVEPLHDDGWSYARLLATAGVEVVLHDHPSLPHGFSGMDAADAPAAGRATALFCDTFAAVLQAGR